MKAFNALKMALIIIGIKGDLRHRNDHAMGNVPKGFSRWATASSYLYDVERILLELEMAKAFVEKLPTADVLKEHSINPEDYVMYHQGYFLDLMHQLKDKLTQLLYAIIIADRNYSSKEERHVTLAKLIKGKPISRIPSLATLLEVWNADIPLDPNLPPNPITIALKKRKNYHHHRNPLTNEENYFQTKTHRSLLSPEMLQHLSDYGKQMISERGQKTSKAWQEESLRKMTTTLEETHKNIEDISRAVISYFQFPRNDQAEGRRIMLQYMPLENSVTIPSCQRKISDVKDLFRDLFNLIYTSAPEAFPETIVSLYAVGSATRDDFMFGISDINIVMVLTTEDEGVKERVQSFIINPPSPIKIPLELTLLSEEQFLSPECDKLRFICKTDGILVGGKDLLRNEKDYKKSYKVVWMLNKDFKDKLLEIKAWTSAQTEIGVSVAYEVVARDLAKRAFRLGFGQVMGNNAVYATGYRDMLRLMNFYTPDNKEVNKRTYKIITNRLKVDKAGLWGLIINYERMLMPLYDAIDKGVNGSQKN